MLENRSIYVKTLTKLGCFLLSLLFSLPGALLAWLGFIAPGWLWCMNFTNTEQFGLVICAIVGFIGLSFLTLGLVILALILRID